MLVLWSEVFLVIRILLCSGLLEFRGFKHLG